MSETDRPRIEISTSRHFTAWLAEHSISLAVTTYQTGTLILFGLVPDGRLSMDVRSLQRTQGMVGDAQTLWVSSLYQLWRFENALGAGRTHKGHDRVFVPRVGLTVGDIDIHDIGLDKSGQPIFVSTAFSCLARPSQTHNFSVVWKPPFISRLAADDRCHLNGLAMREGEPAFVTAVGVSDVADGWRDRRMGGGVLMDVASGETVCEGLSMPHSPRLHGPEPDDKELWLLNSGTGDVGTVDLDTGEFQPRSWLPGYARGLALFENVAVIGLSAPRHGNSTFEGLALHDRIVENDQTPWCGIVVVDLATGAILHWLRFESIVRELYDVAVLREVTRPMALGFKTDDIQRLIAIEGTP